jgi:hypothetical protein
MGSGSSAEDNAAAPEKETLTGEEKKTPTKDKILEGRTCTDWPCLIIFLGYLGFMVYIMVYAYQNGDMNKLTNGVDFQGNVCGSDKTAEFPYLYWCGQSNSFVGFPASLNLELPICVKKCPDEDSETMNMCPKLLPSTQTTDPETPEYGGQAYTVKTTFTTEVMEQPSYPTRSLAKRYCVPNTIADMANVTAAKGLMEQIEQGPMSSKAFQFAQAASSLHNNYKLLIGMGFFAIFLSYAYLLTLRVFAKPLVYGCLAVLSGGVIICSISLLVVTFVEDLHRYNPLYHYMSAKDCQIWCSVISAVGLIVGVLIGVVIFCFHEVIQTAVGCIEAATECMFGMPTMLLEPLVGSVLKIGQFMVLMGGLVALMSTGEISHSSISISGTDVSGIARTVEWNDKQQGYLWAYIFGMFWILEYSDALQNFVISYAVVLWYYSPNDSLKFCGDNCMAVKKPPFLPICRGFIKGVFFHSGSLAAGAFIIACVRMVQFVMKIIQRYSKVQGNRVVACIMTACICCLECFKKVLEYINKNAYIDIVINSNWFLTAAKHSFEFICANPTTIGVLNGACAIFQVIGVACPTFLCSYLTYFLVTHCSRWSDMSSEFYVEDYLPICVAAGVICASICIMFMLVFDQAADTLLYTFIDNKKNDPDTVQEFAPDTLKNLCDKTEKETEDANAKS